MPNRELAPPPAFLVKPGVMEVLVCAVTALVYLGTLSFGFVYDDNVAIVHNSAIRSFHALPHAFVSTQLFYLYRPLTVLWTCLNYFVFGLNAAGWHLATLALHVLVTYLVFRLAYELLQDRNTAFIAALLFGVHPAHVENVAWVAAVNDLLMSVLLLTSFLAFLRYRKQQSNSGLALSLALFASALLTKETAGVFPFLILTFSWIFTDETEHRWGKHVIAALRAPSAFFGVLLVYLFARSFAVRGAASASVGTKAEVVGWASMVLTWPSILWFDLRHLLLPTALSEFYPSEYVTHPELTSFVLPSLLLIAIAVGVWFWIRSLETPRVAYFACAWLFLPLIPALYLRALTPHDFLHDRFLYLPSVGFVILLALAIRQLPALAGSSRQMTQSAVVVLLVLAGMVGTFSNLLPWGSDVLLYQNGLKFVPNSSNLKDNLANALVARGQASRAIPLYQEVLKQDPGFWRSNYNLGHELLKADRYPEAEASLTRAIQIDGSDPDQFILLAVAQWRENKLDDASHNAERAIQRSPQGIGYHYILGMILNASGNRPGALSAMKQELAAHPESATARDEIAKLQSQQ